MDKVLALKSWNQIFGEVLSADKIIDPIEERQQDQPVLDGSIKGIADLVWKEATIAKGKVIEVVDSNEDKDGPPIPSRADLINLS